MKDGIQDELKFGAARAHDGVETAVKVREGLVRLRLDHPNGHQQRAGQADRERRDGCRERVMSQAFANDQRKRHAMTLRAARLMSASCTTDSKPASVSRSWLTRRRAAPFSRHVSRMSFRASRALA